MPFIDDLRQKFPQISSWSDQQVAEDYARQQGIDLPTAIGDLGIVQNKPGIMSDIRRGTGQMIGSTGSALRDTPLSGVGASMERYGGDVAFRNPGEINSFKDVLNHPLTTLREGAGEMAPQVGATLVTGLGGRALGGLAGGLLGGPPGAVAGQWLGGLAAAALPTYLQEYGGIRQDQRKGGTEDIGRAALAAGGATALEFAGGPETLIARRMMGKGAREMTEAGAREIAQRGGLSTLAREGVKTGLVEGPLTEIPQTAMERWGARQDLMSPEAFDEYGVAGAKGFAGGAAFGGPHGLVDRYRAQQQVAAIDRVRQQLASGQPVNLLQTSGDQGSPDFVGPRSPGFPGSPDFVGPQSPGYPGSPDFVGPQVPRGGPPPAPPGAPPPAGYPGSPDFVGPLSPGSPASPDFVGPQAPGSPQSPDFVGPPGPPPAPLALPGTPGFVGPPLPRRAAAAAARAAAPAQAPVAPEFVGPPGNGFPASTGFVGPRAPPPDNQPYATMYTKLGGRYSRVLNPRLVKAANDPAAALSIVREKLADPYVGKTMLPVLEKMHEQLDNGRTYQDWKTAYDIEQAKTDTKGAPKNGTGESVLPGVSAPVAATAGNQKTLNKGIQGASAGDQNTGQQLQAGKESVAPAAEAEVDEMAYVPGSGLHGVADAISKRDARKGLIFSLATGLFDGNAHKDVEIAAELSKKGQPISPQRVGQLRKEATEIAKSIIQDQNISLDELRGGSAINSQADLSDVQAEVVDENAAFENAPDEGAMSSDDLRDLGREEADAGMQAEPTGERGAQGERKFSEVVGGDELNDKAEGKGTGIYVSGVNELNKIDEDRSKQVADRTQDAAAKALEKGSKSGEAIGVWNAHAQMAGKEQWAKLGETTAGLKTRADWLEFYTALGEKLRDLRAGKRFRDVTGKAYFTGHGPAGDLSTLERVDPFKHPVFVAAFMQRVEQGQGPWLADHVEGVYIGPALSTYGAYVYDYTAPGVYSMVFNRGAIEGSTSDAMNRVVQHEIEHVIDDVGRQAIPTRFSNTAEFGRRSAAARELYDLFDRNPTIKWLFTHPLTKKEFDDATFFREFYAQLMSAYYVPKYRAALQQYAPASFALAVKYEKLSAPEVSRSANSASRQDIPGRAGTGLQRAGQAATREGQSYESPAAKETLGTKVVQLFRKLAGQGEGSDALFRYPKSTSKDMVEIMGTIDPGYKIEAVEPFDTDVQDRGVVKKWRVLTPDKRTAAIYQDGDGRVWVNVLNLRSGKSGGSAIYAAVSNYTANNPGTSFASDPEGLSEAAVIRRTELMISAALKYGANVAVEPSGEQTSPKLFKGGDLSDNFLDVVNKLTWSDNKDRALMELMKTSFRNITQFNPEIAHVRYDFDTDTFIDDRTGATIADDHLQRMGRDANRGFARAVGDGQHAAGAVEGEVFSGPSVKRAALFHTILRGASTSAGRQILAGQVGKLSSGGLAASRLKGLYHSESPTTPEPAADIGESTLPDLVDGRDIFLRPGETIRKARFLNTRVVEKNGEESLEDYYSDVYVSMPSKRERGGEKIYTTFPKPAEPGNRFPTAMPESVLEFYPETARTARVYKTEAPTTPYPTEVAQTPNIFVDYIKDTVQHWAKSGLEKIVFAHDLADIAVKNGLKSAARFFELNNIKAATRTRLENNVDRIMDDAATVPDRTALNSFLNDSTREGKWGFKPDWRTDAVVDTAFETRFNALSREAQGVARAVFKYGDSTHKMMQDLVNREINAEFDAQLRKHPARKTVIEQGRAQRLEAQANKLPKIEGPYAPLKRFGQYVAWGKSQAYLDAEANDDATRISRMQTEEEHYRVEFFDTIAEAKAHQRELARQYTFADASVRQKIYRDIQEVPWGAIAKVRGAVGELPGEESTKAALNSLLSDIYLTMLTETSARKSELRRKKVAGEDRNMMRAFATQGRATSHFVAALDHNGEIEQQLRDMRNEAVAGPAGTRNDRTRVLNEIHARYAQGLDYRPTPFVDKAMRVTSIWMLVTSPGYLFQNSLQPFMLTLPMLSARFQAVPAAAALAKAYKDIAPYLKSFAQTLHIDRLPISPDERAMLTRLLENGKLDLTISQDLGRWIDSDNTWTRSKFGQVMMKVMELPQKIEMINRVTSALAAHRLSGGNYNYVSRMIDQTHGNYAASNAPRFMSASGLAKLVTQFRKYQLIQVSLLGRLMHDAFSNASPMERNVARRALLWLAAHHMVLAGTLGLPAINLVGMVLTALGGDDDEPKDFERMMREWIGDKTTADLLLHGAPTAVGLDLTSKIGMGNAFAILPYTELNKLDRANLGKALLGAAGPFFGGWLPQMVDGMGYVAAGDHYKGLETMMPRGLRDAMRAYRFASEGITNKAGRMAMTPDELSAYDIMMQGVGLPTMKVTDRQRLQGDILEMETYYKDRASELRHDYVRAYRAGDTEEMQATRDAWVAMQGGMKRNQFKVTPMSSLLQAPRAQAQLEKSNVAGVEVKKGSVGAARQLSMQ